MEQSIFICNKLGRDKDLENFKAEGIVPKYKILTGNELRSELQRKLIEETTEVHGAKNVEEVADKLADILSKYLFAGMLSEILLR